MNSSIINWYRIFSKIGLLLFVVNTLVYVILFFIKEDESEFFVNSVHPLILSALGLILIVLTKIFQKMKGSR